MMRKRTSLVHNEPSPTGTENSRGSLRELVLEVIERPESFSELLLERSRRRGSGVTGGGHETAKEEQMVVIATSSIADGSLESKRSLCQ